MLGVLDSVELSCVDLGYACLCWAVLGRAELCWVRLQGVVLY